MQNKNSKRLLGIVACVAFISLCAWLFNGSQLASYFGLNGAQVTLSGSTPDTIGDSTLVRHANPEAKIDVVIGLSVRNESALDALIDRQSDPQSPDYLNFISVDEFVRDYSPLTTDVDQVVNFLNANGIKVTKVAKNRLLVEASGTVAQFERAFKVQINEYSLAGAGVNSGGKSYFSNDRDPSIPANLQDIVVSVFGLNDIDRFESRIAKPNKANLNKANPADPAPVDPTNPGAPTAPVAKPKLGQGALTPEDVANAYNLPNDNNKNNKSLSKKLSGQGVKMAIVTAEGYDKSDVEGYWKHYGVTRSGQVIDVPVGGTTSEKNEETTMDLTLMGAQVPASDIYMYIAKDAKFSNFALAFNQMVVDNHAAVMSVSWGLCERGTGRLIMKTENAIFKQAAAQGIALFASSGDDGAYDCKQKKLNWDVDFPSSSPYVTAVGGTTMHHSDGVRQSESAWSGSGGGISRYWKRPKWQSGKGIDDGDMRVSADVAMSADPWTGYSVLYEGKYTQIGGTSASSPTFAALWGLAVEGSGRRLGVANAHIYRLGRSSDYGKVFYDVTSGANGAGRGPGYKAEPNWDHATGWGAPNGEALVNYLSKNSASKSRPK